MKQSAVRLKESNLLPIKIFEFLYCVYKYEYMVATHALLDHCFLEFKGVYVHILISYN